MERSDLNHIGALIEMPPLYENLTAYENLKVRTTILGLTDKRIDEVLQIVRLTETGKKRAGQFSLGMKQRLGIAVALLNNPKLLILDEPTNGLTRLGLKNLESLSVPFLQRVLPLFYQVIFSPRYNRPLTTSALLRAAS